MPFCPEGRCKKKVSLVCMFLKQHNQYVCTVGSSIKQYVCTVTVFNLFFYGRLHV